MWGFFFRKPDQFGADRSPGWRALRERHVAEHPECFLCGSRDDLEVHHIVPFHVEPSLELEPKNLVTLCHEHHLRVGHNGNWRRVNKQVIYDCLVAAETIAALSSTPQ